MSLIKPSSTISSARRLHHGAEKLLPAEPARSRKATCGPRPNRLPAAAAPVARDCAGRCLSDWAAAPVSASYLGFGYVAEQGGQFVAFGHPLTPAVRRPQRRALVPQTLQTPN